MQLDSMKPAPGSRRPRKRIGRGPGSGHGKTAGKGHKGQNSRSGGGTTPGFEGGQMPLTRRLPKRGFTNPSRVEFEILNLDSLERFEAGATVDDAALRAAGLVTRRRPIKVLGGGTIDRALTVRVAAFSGSAKEAITRAGGKAEVVGQAASSAVADTAASGDTGSSSEE